MAEIKLTQDDLTRLAEIGKTIKEKGLPAAQDMAEEFRKEFKIRANMEEDLGECVACIEYCEVCKLPVPGSPLIAIVGIQAVQQIR